MRDAHGARRSRTERRSSGPWSGGERGWRAIGSRAYRTGGGVHPSIARTPRGGRALPPIEVRPFHRRDREQLAALVNGHIGALLPGVSVSVNAVMSQLERDLLGEDDSYLRFLTALGWRELTRAQRGWSRVSEAP
jgi:hypothetical protein